MEYKTEWDIVEKNLLIMYGENTVEVEEGYFLDNNYIPEVTWYCWKKDFDRCKKEAQNNKINTKHLNCSKEELLVHYVFDTFYKRFNKSTVIGSIGDIGSLKDVKELKVFVMEEFGWPAN
jgi:hypothetical protein